MSSADPMDFDLIEEAFSCWLISWIYIHLFDWPIHWLCGPSRNRISLASIRSENEKQTDTQ